MSINVYPVALQIFTLTSVYQCLPCHLTISTNDYQIAIPMYTLTNVNEGQPIRLTNVYSY